jgi:hypothetical protein
MPTIEEWQQKTPQEQQDYWNQNNVGGAGQYASKNAQAKDALYGAGDPSSFQLTGSPEQRGGALQGLQFGQMLYGQGIGDVGKEAADYASQVKGRLNTDYAKSDVMRQEAGQRIGAGNAKAGLSGIDTTGVSLQASRQSGMAAATANQDYKDKALALYGRNISSKQQGLAGQYTAGAGIGQANTPGAVSNYSSGTFGCLALVSVGLMSKETHASELPFINSNSYEYIGYCLIVTPFIPLILRNGKFAKFFSFMAHKYVLNLTGAKKTILGKLIKLIGGSFCSVIGKLC